LKARVSTPGRCFLQRRGKAKPVFGDRQAVHVALPISAFAARGFSDLKSDNPELFKVAPVILNQLNHGFVLVFQPSCNDSRIYAGFTLNRVQFNEFGHYANSLLDRLASMRA
jgi:hypothetical protein